MKSFFVVLLITFFPGFLLTGCTQEKPKECNGFFRWDVKTLTDNNGTDLLPYPPLDSTISQLVSVQPPERMFVLSKKDGRLPRFSSEKYLVRVIAFIDKIKIQGDQDFHIVLRSPDSKASLIAEIPDPDCPSLSAFPGLKEKFRTVRNQADSVRQLLKKTKTPVLVEVTGVPFWDAPHFWVRGSSRTGREIHPILNIRILEN
jgi:hypothetical protein